MELPTPESTPESHSPERATRIKHLSTAVRVNKSSGPATSTAEARKNKKGGKKSSKPHQHAHTTETLKALPR